MFVSKTTRASYFSTGEPNKAHVVETLKERSGCSHESTSHDRLSGSFEVPSIRLVTMRHEISELQKIASKISSGNELEILPEDYKPNGGIIHVLFEVHLHLFL